MTRAQQSKQARRTVLIAARAASDNGEHERARALFATVGISYESPSELGERQS